MYTSRMTIRALLLIARWIGLAHDRWRESVARRRPLAAEVDALRERIEKLRAENELLRARLRRLDPHRRPHFRPWERLQILAHRARYSMSVEATANTFVLARNSVLNWMKDVENGVTRLVHAREPVNKLPDLVREISWFVKREWPRWGSRRIAGILARLGVKASRTSVQRALRRPPPRRSSAARLPRPGSLPRAKGPRHVFAIDFTRIGGMFRSVAVAALIDVFSRKVLAIRVSAGQPDAAFACALLGRTIRDHGKPTWVLTDRGGQFVARRFARFARQRGIRRRFGPRGQPGLPAIDRWFRTLKDEFARGLFLYRPIRAIERDLARYVGWYNGSRPHGSLRSRSPDEVFFDRPPRRIRRMDRATLHVGLIHGDRRLPIFTLRPAA
jgi:putative transposase